MAGYRERRVRRIMTLVLTTAAAAGMAAAAVAAQSPTTVRASIVTAALAQESVHWTETLVLDMAGRVVSTADVNADSGRERVSIELPPWAGGSVHIVLVHGIAYVNGNPAGLRYKLRLTKAQANRYAGQWISIPKGDHLYSGVASGLTLGSMIHHVTPRQPLKLGRARSHGRRLLVVQEMSGGLVNASLSAYARGSRLPVGWASFVGMGNVDGGRFSKWNEPVSLHAPASSTPIAKVRG